MKIIFYFIENNSVLKVRLLGFGSFFAGVFSFGIFPRFGSVYSFLEVGRGREGEPFFALIFHLAQKTGRLFFDGYKNEPMNMDGTA